MFIVTTLVASVHVIMNMKIPALWDMTSCQLTNSFDIWQSGHLKSHIAVHRAKEDEDLRQQASIFNVMPGQHSMNVTKFKLM
jgi:hypothetical protein